MLLKIKDILKSTHKNFRTKNKNINSIKINNFKTYNSLIIDKCLIHKKTS